MRVKGERVLKNGRVAGYVYYPKEKKWKWRFIGGGKNYDKHIEKKKGEGKNYVEQRLYALHKTGFLNGYYEERLKNYERGKDNIESLKKLEEELKKHLEKKSNGNRKEHLKKAIWGVEYKIKELETKKKKNDIIKMLCKEHVDKTSNPSAWKKIFPNGNWNKEIEERIEFCMKMRKDDSKIKLPENETQYHSARFYSNKDKKSIYNKEQWMNLLELLK